MQTRKRAKSVMFGRKQAEPENREKKEPTKHHVVVKEEEHEAHKTAEKASVVERRPVHEKPQMDETLSAELPKNDDDTKSEEETNEVEETVSKNDLIEDSSSSEVPEAPKDVKEALSETPSKPAAVPESEQATSSKSLETPAQPVATPEHEGSEELSSTLPPSAFTIQSDEQAPVESTTPTRSGKKRFIVYFFVVAFISFVLGLAAMAGASYFGIANLHLTNLTNDVHVPGILSKKPTPTLIPPTAAPTQKPVSLSAYTISVLNGSGIAGKAASEKTALTGAGFTVSTVGNAANSNFTQTEISAKSSVDQAYLAKLESTLQKDYQVDSTVATSPASSQTDVTVTLGSSTAQ